MFIDILKSNIITQQFFIDQGYRFLILYMTRLKAGGITSAVKTRVVFDKHALPPLYKQVGIYARVSTRSTEQMESLAIQVSELVSRFRNQYQIRIYDVYIDVLSGAHTENRPSYQRMMNDCRIAIS